MRSFYAVLSTSTTVYDSNIKVTGENMKVLVIGASGTLGSQIVKALAATHEIIAANLSSGDVQIDITNIGSIQSVF